MQTAGFNGTDWYDGVTPPRAHFRASATSGDAPLTVLFTNLSLLTLPISHIIMFCSLKQDLRKPKHSMFN